MTSLYTELFPTFVVGSLPRPEWLRRVVLDRRDGNLDAESAEHLFDIAIPSAIAMQERAGIDFVSDGEWRRESYIKVIAEHVDGFEAGLVRSLKHTVDDPAVVAPIKRREDLTTKAAKFLLANTHRKAIVTLPSPYILGWRMWREDVSGAAYSTREEFMAASAEILREEVEGLVAAGVDHIQIDEPWLLLLVDPEHRARIGVRNIEKEIETCTGMINEVVKTVGDTPTSVHMCHAHFGRERYGDGGYEPIIDALADINVDRFAMEFAAPESHGVGVLARFPAGKVLGLGVIDQIDTNVETPEIVIERVEEALKHVPADRMTLNPDCGFSPGAQNPMDIDEAFLKLSAMSAAAMQLRKRHG
ncbi:MAG: cobalamin-independent methionine synthase II family protein [Dehalococcoidia bacterium]|nr:cobalamin-independent methionine synthase II family protein [Dehalococcoidia bacterium]